MLRRNDGYTLIELLLVLVIIGILVVVVLGCGVLGCGNYWYTEDGVLRQLRADHIGITEIIKTNRNVFAKSVITVKESGVNSDYCLDTNILWNYEFIDCQK